MATFFVSQLTGDDTNSGTLQTSPKQTIASAQTAASNGDSVCFIDPFGIHAENVSLGYILLSKSLRYYSLDPSRPVTLHGLSGSYSVRTAIGGITFQNLRIATSPTCSYVVLSSDATGYSNIRFIGVEFENLHGRNAVWVLQGGGGSHDNWVFDNCKILTNGHTSNGFTLDGIGTRIDDCDFRQTLASQFGIRLLAGCDDTEIVNTKIGGSFAFEVEPTTGGKTHTLRDCTIEAGTSAVNVKGGAKSVIDGLKSRSNLNGVRCQGDNNNIHWSRIDSTASNIAIAPCQDGQYSGNTGSLADSRAEAWGANGYALLLGEGAEDMTVVGTYAEASGSGTHAVTLNGQRNHLTRIHAVGGSLHCLLLKGAIDCSVTDSDLYQHNQSGATIEIRNGKQTPTPIVATGNQGRR